MFLECPTIGHEFSYLNKFQQGCSAETYYISNERTSKVVWNSCPIVESTASDAHNLGLAQRIKQDTLAGRRWITKSYQPPRIERIEHSPSTSNGISWAIQAFRQPILEIFLHFFLIFICRILIPLTWRCPALQYIHRNINRCVHRCKISCAHISCSWTNDLI